MKTFISSTYDDLIPYREQVADGIERLGQQAVRMEVFGARPMQATRACFDEISGCDAFIGVYAHRYGYIPDNSNLSITEQEFNHALKRNLPIFCYVVDENFPWPPKYIDTDQAHSKLIALKHRINVSYVRDIFTTPDDLGFKVAASVGRYLTTQKIKEQLTQARLSETSLAMSGFEQVARRSVRISEIIKGSSVLIVNDSPNDMRAVIRILEELNVDVQIAESTYAAIGLLEGHRFDVVLSDMVRGRNDKAGLELLTKVKERGFCVPIIITVGQFRPDLGIPPYAFGITNRVDELFNLIFDAVERARG
jgi:CheY-like chemotaxis protein